MTIINALSRSRLWKSLRRPSEIPRRAIWNWQVAFTALVYAMCGVPQTWDQGTSASMPSLEGFQDHFGISSGADADEIRTFVSIVYVGYIVGAAGSFLINNRLGRLWSFRLYAFVYIIGQLIATFSPNVACLYVSRVVTGIGIGSITVSGPMAIVEIAPAETRGVLASWYPVTMGLALLCANLCVLGILNNVPSGKLQFQIPWFSVSVWMAGVILASFFICESPRWLLLVGRREDAIQTLVRLRSLPPDHARITMEIDEIQADLDKTKPPNAATLVKDMFTVPSNLRRLQQVLFSYALAQLSGANSITSYFVPFIRIVGGEDIGESESIFLGGMYALAKLGFSLVASFLFIDALGRRKSLLIGVAVQMLSHLYISIYLKKRQYGPVSPDSSRVAIAALFVHALGYAVGLLILPYIFASEIWPNRIRSFGTALGATFHWSLVLALKYSIPSLLSSTDQWGAFLFFAAWCLIAWLYVFFCVPEVSGMSVEEIDQLFKGPWFQAYRRKRDLDAQVVQESETNSSNKVTTKSSTSRVEVC